MIQLADVSKGSSSKISTFIHAYRRRIPAIRAFIQKRVCKKALPKYKHEKTKKRTGRTRNTRENSKTPPFLAAVPDRPYVSFSFFRLTDSRKVDKLKVVYTIKRVPHKEAHEADSSKSHQNILYPVSQENQSQAQATVRPRSLNPPEFVIVQVKGKTSI